MNKLEREKRKPGSFDVYLLNLGARRARMNSSSIDEREYEDEGT